MPASVRALDDGSTGPTETADELIGRLAGALRARVEAQRRAEDRLASFAFTEEPATGRSDPLGWGGRATVDWSYFATGALRIVGEPGTLRLLGLLRGNGLPLDELAPLIGSGEPDRLAVADRVGALTSGGLVVRELESDRITLTPLGTALLDLVDMIARRANPDEP